MQKLFLSVAVLMSSVGLSIAAAPNLIKNPGFESGTKIGTSNGSDWWLFDGAANNVTATVDSTVAHGGKASARLEGEAGTRTVLVSPRFNVAQGDELHFEVWVRTSAGSTNKTFAQAGLAFRNKAGNVVQQGRVYFHSSALTGDWALMSGNARVPNDAVTAEAHLGYTNFPATIWYDDVVAYFMNPISFSLVEEAKPWTGPQEITVRVANHQTVELRGSVACTINKAVSQSPVDLAPGATRDFKLPITLTNIGQHEYKIALREGTSSSPVPSIVLHGKFHTAPPFSLFPACPCYQIAGNGNGETRFDAHLNLNPTERGGGKFVVEVLDAADHHVLGATNNTSHGQFTGVTVRLPMDKPAVYYATATVYDRAGNKLGTEKTDVHVTTTNNARVTLGDDGFLRVNDSPEFPIGMYESGHDEEMSKAGFSVTHNYGITTGDAEDPINQNDLQLKILLDKTWASGMRMMVELPRTAIEKAKWEQIRHRIETFRHHPGVLCWGSEERVARGVAPLTNITALYKLVHELDPDHPLVLGDTRDVIQKFKTDRRDFFPDDSMDVGIWWWYPFPLHDVDGDGLEGAADKISDILEPPSWLTTTHSKKPLWIALQAYQKSGKHSTFPTPAEYRCQAYLSIINGVKGIFYYVGFGQHDYQGKSSGLLNKPDDSHWVYVQKLAGELRGFSPIIVAPKATAEFTLSPTTAPIEFTTRQALGKTYIIAANKSEQIQKDVIFEGASLRDSKVNVLFEDRPVAVDGQAIKDDFGGFGVHIYEINPPDKSKSDSDNK